MLRLLKCRHTISRLASRIDLIELRSYGNWQSRLPRYGCRDVRQRGNHAYIQAQLGVRVRALLVGIPAYDDEKIDNLPFIEDDFVKLAKTLTNVGYDVTTHDYAATDRDRIDSALEQFCLQAPVGELLLIILSGHGVHRNGIDYLVPSSAITSSARFVDRCLAIDFRDYFEQSKCGDVLIVVDACREGIHLQEKSNYFVGWSSYKRRSAAARRIAYLYACGEGESARYVKSDIDSYSIFSQALNIVLVDTAGPSDLSRVSESIQKNIDILTAENGLPAQKAKLTGDVAEAHSFIVFERPQPPESATAGREHPWVLAARAHSAWDLTEATPLKEATLARIEQWAAIADAAASFTSHDPWWDPEFARRTSERVDWLLTCVINRQKLVREPDDSPLTGGEAALLVATPFAEQALWAASSAKVRDLVAAAAAGHNSAADTQRQTDFEAFSYSFPGLMRRLARLRDYGGAEAEAESIFPIRMWILRQWISNGLVADASDRHDWDAFSPIRVSDDVAVQNLLDEVFEPSHLKRIVESCHFDSEKYSNVSATQIIPDLRTIATNTANEQTIRDKLVRLLLATARHFAIDPSRLSSVIPEHIGISDPVRPQDVVATARRASWSPRGRTRALSAECSHQAVDVALHDYTASFTQFLQQIHASSAEHYPCLADLPTHVSADEVKAIIDDSGTPSYSGQGFRFRLADDRVQELLMGTQLYGDPGLAIRELYQNALDACRYRAAREAYLVGEFQNRESWTPRIDFIEGVSASGQPYLDCIDNGIGMGHRELIDVFSNAGIRFADLPETVREIRQWRDRGIEFYPNSAFGIGVLSYFMLADEIKVETCRLGSDGTPGEKLEVSIPGPGALSRIRKLGRGTEVGTWVRLLLRKDKIGLSCANMLSKVLWQSDVRVTTSGTAGKTTWGPNELSPSAPVGSVDALATDAIRLTNDFIPTESPRAWWCAGRGAILADGLWAGAPIFGAVVNLAHADMPRLTVDRRNLLDKDGVTSKVTNLLREHATSVVRGGFGSQTNSWLRELLMENPQLAEAVGSTAIETPGSHWMIAGRDVAITQVGCFLDDEFLFSNLPTEQTERAIAELPEKLCEWRLQAWTNAGLVDGLSYGFADAPLLARPLDSVLLAAKISSRLPQSRYSSNYILAPREEWLDIDRPMPFENIVIAAHLFDFAVPQLIARIGRLGYKFDNDEWPSIVTDDLELLTLKIEHIGPGNSALINVHQVILLGALSNRQPSDIATRLRELGYKVVDRQFPSLRNEDLRVLSRDGDAKPPFVHHSGKADVAHILNAARLSNSSVAETVERVREIGLSIPNLNWSAAQIGDAELFSFESYVQQLDPDAPEFASASHIMWTATKTRRTASEVAARFCDLGFNTPSVAWPELVRGDGDLMIVNINRRPVLLDFNSPVPAAHIVLRSTIENRSANDVAHRLQELGFAVPEMDWLAVHANHSRFVTDLNREDQSFLATESMSQARIYQKAAQTGYPPDHVAAKLRAFGYSVPDINWLSADSDFILLFSGDFDNQSPWLNPEDVVPDGHILAGAAFINVEPRQIAEFLVAAGFSVLPREWPRVLPDDTAILSSGLNKQSPWLASDDAVDVGHILAAASKTGRTAEDICERLVTLGYDFVGPDKWPECLPDDHRILDAWLGDDGKFNADRAQKMLAGHLTVQGTNRWLRYGTAVPSKHLIYAAAALHRPLGEIARRLVDLGYELPPGLTVIDTTHSLAT